MEYTTKTHWRFKTCEGVKAELQMVGASNQGPEQGLIAWHVQVGTKSYKALVPAADYSTKLLAKFILHFRYCPAWREHFRQETPQYEKVEVTLITGNSFQVDRGIATYVSALCDQGYPVIESRQGDDLPYGRTAMIKFGNLIPEPIEQAARALGWLNLDLSIEPVCPRGWVHEYNQRVHLLLDDWLHSDVDASGERYALHREPLAFIQDWPKLPEQAMVEHERKVRKDVDRINKLDTRATFQDLVGLTSGRDRYSRLNLEKLKALMVDDVFLGFLEHKLPDPAALARGIRWHLRGLEVDLIIRKAHIEAMLNLRDERKREEYRQQKAMEPILC
ncbi:hypothetical protein [Pseudomonas sp. CFBP 13719]|uniref:hypothetical protein n=1 Tax=Pseudomonas sp. CFBP 13719 TaxID=2775303 RepID=UPI001786F86D|nr:hypothetical protein [Pseudomonas sp. CFBP 13719]MBD8614769.1 hypothetical protein [Pseudomonas putida]MBD8681547.1 hypothetical protein [Pseudomonas sp. CFBP 13719]